MTGLVKKSYLLGYGGKNTHVYEVQSTYNAGYNMNDQCF